MRAGTALVFGGRGGLGAAIADQFRSGGWTVLVTSRAPEPGAPDAIAVDPWAPDGDGLSSLDGIDVCQAVVWAQGDNVNDAADHLDVEVHERVLRANTLFVSATLARLLASDRIGDGARLCVLSSIWELVARQGKFSYTVSKAAVGGLVRAAALDLAPRGILVNAVLPGVVDTAMTRAMLTEEQLAMFEQATGFGRLVTAADVAAVVGFLCSEANGGVTGQSIAVDLGYHGGRVV